MSSTRSTIKLAEYQPEHFGHNVIAEELGEDLYRRYGKQVDVQFPSPKTDQQWELTSQGWVGYIPLSDELGVRLEPKVVGLENLFRMLEYAYDLRFEILDDITDCSSLQEFYERLANVLAKRVIDRSRKGLYRTYISEVERLPYVCGRWDVNESARRPWDARVRCEYEDHTADNEENQILAWTLLVIIRSRLCTNRVLSTVRRAYRALQHRTTLSPKTAAECLGRLYNRLNIDYHPMHALCRFFLEQTGPTHHEGGHTVLPFLVNMSSLFERFVAMWLKDHTPEGLLLRIQEKIHIDEERGLRFAVDLVLVDSATHVARYVLDTKYKVVEQPAARDIEQVVAYAEAMHCQEAVLIYPVDLPYALDRRIGRIRVRNLGFCLDRDLEEAGLRFLDELLVTAGTTPANEPA